MITIYPGTRASGDRILASSSLIMIIGTRDKLIGLVTMDPHVMEGTLRSILNSHMKYETRVGIDLHACRMATMTDTEYAYLSLSTYLENMTVYADIFLGILIILFMSTMYMERATFVKMA